MRRLLILGLVLSLEIIPVGCGKILEKLTGELTNHAPVIRSLTASPASLADGVPGSNHQQSLKK